MNKIKNLIKMKMASNLNTIIKNRDLIKMVLWKNIAMKKIYFKMNNTLTKKK